MTRLRLGSATASVICALALLGSPVLAQDAKKAADTNVYNTLRDIINQGADLYNSGDWSGCHRLYEGALLTVRPFLEHRPDQQKAITEGIARVEQRFRPVAISTP